MKAKIFQNKLLVKKSRMHGYGVFALKTIKKGELIEECYTLVSKGGDKRLEDFYFDAKGNYALLLGFGSIYNHAEEPNADYKINIKNKLTRIKAIATIRKGEEIYVSYGDEWFSSRGMRPKKVPPKKK
ncbi:MAG: SET domain-containing protein-lysine N-methyltransferase [Gammaproteobacteria bacterium]|nr:SET domain-containing protein-lysine N-methyltransferase [Gammaproteobacteria bacterium]